MIEDNYTFTHSRSCLVNWDPTSNQSDRVLRSTLSLSAVREPDKPPILCLRNRVDQHVLEQCPATVCGGLGRGAPSANQLHGRRLLAFFAWVSYTVPSPSVCADGTAATLFTLVLPPSMGANATAATLFARVPDPAVRANCTASALLTLAFVPTMHTDTASATFLTLVLSPPVQTNATATTLFTLALPPRMYADVASAAFFTLALVPPMYAEATSATLFARVLNPPVCAHAAFTLCTFALDPSVCACGGTATLCTLAPEFSVLALRLLPDAPVASGCRAALLRRSRNHGPCIRSPRAPIQQAGL
jgi:hypothetical protein